MTPEERQFNQAVEQLKQHFRRLLEEGLKLREAQIKELLRQRQELTLNLHLEMLPKETKTN